MRWTKEKSAKEKREDRRAKQEPKWRQLCEWHPWFAWWPVTVPDNYLGKQSVWLEWIERRLNDYRRQFQPSPELFSVLDSSDYEYRFSK